MKRTEIIHILDQAEIGKEVNIKGWVKTFRNDQFLTINDGSTLRNIQVVLNPEQTPEDLRKRLYTGTSVSVIGVVQESLGKGQNVEVIGQSLIILGDCDPNEFPIQMKKHS
jgi:asparaginyl-tRNA synthetase